MVKKRIKKLVVIGGFHSTLYLYIVPYLVLPRIDSGYKFIAMLLISTLSIIVTFFIVRFLK